MQLISARLLTSQFWSKGEKSQSILSAIRRLLKYGSPLYDGSPQKGYKFWEMSGSRLKINVIAIWLDCSVPSCFSLGINYITPDKFASMLFNDARIISKGRYINDIRTARDRTEGGQGGLKIANTCGPTLLIGLHETQTFWGGIHNPENFADVIYEWSLIKLLR